MSPQALLYHRELQYLRACHKASRHPTRENRKYAALRARKLAQARRAVRGEK